MSELLLLGSYGAVAVIAMMSILWIVSVAIQDASIVDRVWGLGFVLQAWVYAIASGATGFLPILTLCLVSVWGLRLSLHIHLRNRGHSEDYRYQRMRSEHGGRFWWYSYFSVFLLQAIIAWIVAAPLLWIMAKQQPVNGMPIVLIGAAVWAIGFVFEAVGDWQLRRFKSNPDNKGKLLTKGLWRLTRHPNYFGDATVWWGYFVMALAVDSGWQSAFGPLLMTLLIRYVSGVSMLEKDQIKKYPEFADYIRNTPAMIPRLWALHRGAQP